MWRAGLNVCRQAGFRARASTATARLPALSTLAHIPGENQWLKAISAVAVTAAVTLAASDRVGASVSCESVAAPHVKTPNSAVTQNGAKYASLPEMIEDVMPALCKIQGAIGDRELGGGSAFIISEDGLLVTNDHVFQAIIQAGAREIHAHFDDGRCYRVEPLAADTEADIAIGRISDAPPGTRFKALELGSNTGLRRGDDIVVLGAPLGGSLVPAAGVLSTIRYVADDEIMNYVLNSRSDWCLLQVDANMSSGNSGGPIVDRDGRVVGVSVMVQTSGGMGVGNLNFGVAIDQAKPIIEALLKRGRVTRAAIGMTIVLVDRLTARKEAGVTGMALLPPSGQYTTGLLVTYAIPGKPAEAAGLREGDVILEINGRPMQRKGDYFAALGPVYKPGHSLTCTVWRPLAGGGGKQFTCTITPTEREESPAEIRRRTMRRMR